MQESPLTQQPRPEAFQPKIVQLYEELFKDDEDGEQTEGFWREFFLLKPDRAALRRILDDLAPSDLLHLEDESRELFARSVKTLKTGHGPEDLHALETLSTFLGAVLAKKYNNPTTDIITVLAGLERIDAVFSDFVSAIDTTLRNGRDSDVRRRVVELALSVDSGAYQTSLLTYFIQRDLFPAIIKFIQDTQAPQEIVEAFTLVGMLANYNKFEFQNPYQLRMNDFVNEAAIQKVIGGVGFACQSLRAQYVEVLDDMPEGWTIASTLHKIGLGAVAPGPRPPPKPVVYDAETQKKMFSELPGEQAAILLATYDFTLANKLFSFNLVTLPGPKPTDETPFASFTSLTSYLLQHAHLSRRTTLYTHLNLMIFRLVIEDAVLCKRLCSDESKVPVRLCRQRQPFLPQVKGERVLATAVMDVMVDGINHNLRRRLDVGLYTLCVGILLRIVSFMSRSRTRLAYHWAELFRSLLALVRFLTTYAPDLKDMEHIDTLLDHVVNLLALGLSSGEAFLPTPAAYDDLFYKVVEAGDLLLKFRDTYGLNKRPSNSISTLLSVSAHYKRLLAEGGPIVRGKSGSRDLGQLTSLQVAEVIKQGYETLSIQAKEGLDSWERYREADERALLKRVARTAVEDVKKRVGE